MIGGLLDVAKGIANWRTSTAMALQDISLRYRRSVLGPFWISATLVTTVVALSYLFGHIFEQEYRSYSAYIGAGLLVWTFISTVASEGANSMLEHGPYLQNIPMPLSVIASRIMIRNAIVFVHNAVAIFVVLTLLGVSYSASALAAIPGMLCLFVAAFFTALILGPLSARYRDIPQIVNSAIQIVFFLTPIIWMREQVAGRTMLTDANPLYHLIEIVRAPLLGERATELNWTVSLLTIGVLMVLGIVSAAVSRKRVALWV